MWLAAGGHSSWAARLGLGRLRAGPPEILGPRPSLVIQLYGFIIHLPLG